MPVKEKELRKTVKIGIRTLILQEVRLLRLEHSLTPHLIKDEISHSIQDTKKEIVKLTKAMAQKERAALLRKMIRQTVDEEIDRAIELRKTRCVRCLHGRFYDEAGTGHVRLPVKTRAEAIGCDKLRPSLRKTCRRFVEMSTAVSLDQYLNEMTLLYEFRDVISRVEEVWRDYLAK
jgi:hypothetical protein